MNWRHISAVWMLAYAMSIAFPLNPSPIFATFIATLAFAMLALGGSDD